MCDILDLAQATNLVREAPTWLAACSRKGSVTFCLLLELLRRTLPRILFSLRSNLSLMDTNVDSFPFVHLPVDVQYQICRLFCPHCHDDGDLFTVLHCESTEGNRALLRLASTCHRVRAVCEPVLYHYPRITCYTAFFRTLMGRPELAEHVKVMNKVDQNEIKDFTYGKTGFHREDFLYLRYLAYALQLGDSDEDAFNKLFPGLATRGGDGFSRLPVREQNRNFVLLATAYDNLITSIMVAMCPFIQVLSINIDNGATYDGLTEGGSPLPKFIFLPKLIGHNSGSLEFVHTLIVRNTEHHSPYSLGLDRIAFLWQALPNVRRLVFDRSSWDGLSVQLSDSFEKHVEYDWSALAKLKEIRFLKFSRQSLPLPLRGMKRLIKGCNRLEKFVFHPQNLQSDTFLPLCLVRILLPAAQHLQYLAIYCPPPEEASVDSQFLLNEEVKKLEVLKKLVIDEPTFCRHYHDQNDELVGNRSQCITNLLPTSVEQLTVYLRGRLDTYHDIMDLAECVLLGEFPNLSQIRVVALFEETQWPYSSPRTSGRAQYMVRIPNNLPRGGVNESPTQLVEAIGKWLLDAFQVSGVSAQFQCYRRNSDLNSADKARQLLGHLYYNVELDLPGL